jgi:hypothetical protein
MWDRVSPEATLDWPRRSEFQPLLPATGSDGAVPDWRWSLRVQSTMHAVFEPIPGEPALICTNSPLTGAVGPILDPLMHVSTRRVGREAAPNVVAGGKEHRNRV